ncbi:MAG: peptidylprolyl isomerase [Hormoscilla sp. GM102CHS1]|nr:peptidylprolyl isomerase [Hormoscilla sp. GM102CHS1]
MQIEAKRWLSILLVIAALLMAGCMSQATTTSGYERQASNQENSNLPRLLGKATVEMMVEGKDSPIIINLDGTQAPITAGNFVDLVDRGVYDGLVFHRVVREPQPFVVQGGDPQSKDPKFSPERLGTGSYIEPATSQARYIPLEITPQGSEEPVYSQTFKSASISVKPVLKHTRGAVAMARSPYPDSASSQFYFCLADLPFLDGDYAVFGYVTEGMNVVDSIVQGDRIKSVRVVQGLEYLRK